MNMQGNTILVAGGTSGIGRGLAELLCRLGNEVIIFGAPTDAMNAIMRANPGMQSIALDLSDPWSVAGFADRLGATHPRLNMFVNISIAFPVKYLPGLNALLEDDDTSETLEAHRLGIQHLTGALLPRLRKQAQGSVMNLSVGPASWPQALPPLAPSLREAMEGGVNACTLSVRKRWASARVEVINVSPSAMWTSAVPAAMPGAPPLAEFVSSVANLLAEGLHEEAAITRLSTLRPAPRPAALETWDDQVTEAY